MEKPLSFKFYEETSYEDAGPYLNENTMIVCDGCGGAGGFYHHVKPELIDSFEKIKQLVLPEETDESSDEFLKEYFSPIYEDPTVNRTSAFWASRIALARYIFFLNDKDFDQEKAKDFVAKGLDDVAKKLNLEKPIIGSKTLLPTTLVSISLLNPDRKRFEAEVFWAGDSRAYLLSKDGLKQLTIDDEDETGAITNLFTAKEGHHTKMNRREYRNIEKPCALFVCSDGLFDNYSDLDFEYLLLGMMNEANDLEDYRNKLVNFYNKSKSDDCTMAFTALGFEDFTQMKQYFTERNDYVANLHAKYLQYRDYLLLKQKPELFDDYLSKIISRTNDKKDSIIAAIEEELRENRHCSLIDHELVAHIQQKINKRQAEDMERFEQKKVEVVGFIKDYIIEHYPKVLVKGFFDYDAANAEQEVILSKLYDLCDEINKIEYRIEDFEKERDDYEEQCERFFVGIDQLIKALVSANIIDEEEAFKRASVFKENMKQGIIEPEALDNLLPLMANLFDEPCFEKDFIRFNSYSVKAARYPNDIAFIESKKEEYVGYIKALFDDVQNIYPLIRERYLDETVAPLLDELRESEPTYAREVAIGQTVIIEYLKNEDTKDFVIRRLKLGNVPTCIDCFYNASLLKNLITLYEANNGGSSDFNAFYEEYQKYQQELMSLVEQE